MRDITTEQKLRLVQQVRSRYNKNQNDMSSREMLLYGKTSVPIVEGDGETLPDGAASASFKLRLLLSLLLFAVVVFMDIKDVKIGGLTSEKIYGMIAADYEDTLEKWVETLSQGNEASHSSPQR